jgi:geranylgeranyl diphosphate synthase type I
MSNLSSELKNFKFLFEPKIKLLFEQEKDFVKKINMTGLDSLIKVEKLTMTGGKRFRPFLVYLGYHLFKSEQGSENLENLFLLGCSLEVFQSFCLIHDDIIDEAETRRGFLTVEKEFQKEFTSKTLNHQHLGSSAAILAGDLAFVFANKWFARLTNRTQLLEQKFYEMQAEVCCGQMDDTFGVGIENLESLAEEKIVNMLNYKSGRYSIEKPLVLGSVLAGADDKKIEIISQIGIKLGVAFQLTDDVLGLFGKDKITGKSTNGDILEGKRTLLVHKAYQVSSNSEKQKMSDLLGKKDISEAEINWFKNHLQTTGAKDGVLNYAKKLVDQANQTLISNFENSENLDLLLEFGKYLINRDI